MWGSGADRLLRPPTFFDLLNHGRRGVVGATLHLLCKDHRSQPGRRSSKPTIHASSVPVHVDLVTSFSLIRMADIERAFVELDARLPIQCEQVFTLGSWLSISSNVRLESGLCRQSWRTHWCWS